MSGAHEGVWHRAWRHLRRDRLGLLGLGLVAGVILAAVCGPWLAPYAPEAQQMDVLLQGPSGSHWFGADELGRDVLSRLLHGARVSVALALVTSALAVALGVGLGAWSGWVGGRLDNVLMRGVDALYAFPDLLLVIMIGALMGRGFWAMALSLSLVSWVTVARVVRGEVLAIKGRPFVEAAVALGLTRWRVLTRHVLPHVVSPVLVTLTFRIPSVILAESTLSFIGLGLQPPESSWGVLAASGWSALSLAPHLILAPAVAIFVTILGFNLLGDALRDALASGA